MTEREQGLPKNPDNPNYPAGLEFLTDSILNADAQRQLYEDNFIYQISKAPNTPQDLLTPNQKSAYIASRITTIKLILTSSFGAQKVLDSVDIESLAQDVYVEISDSSGVVQDTVPIEKDQMENYLRTGVNINNEAYKFDEDGAKKILIKRFTEAKKLADERDVPIELVFDDQALYFELIRRSLSPEEIIKINRQTNEDLKKSLSLHIKHDLRTGTIIANEKNESVTINDIDSVISKRVDSPKLKEEMNEDMQQMDEYVERACHATIERYWGPKTAALFK